MDVRRRWFGSWAACTALAGAAPASAQPPTLLERQQGMHAVADQKAEADVREAVAAADKFAAASPATAARRLREALTRLDLTAAISRAKREELARHIQERIAALEGRPAAPAIDPRLAQQHAAQRQALERLSQETRDVRDGAAKIEQSLLHGNFAGGQRKAAELGQKYPNNPAVLALGGQSVSAERVADAKAMAHAQDRRVVSALGSVQKSALPPTADVEYPKGWAEKMARRDEAERLDFGPEERAILEALEKPAGSGIKDGPFLETVQSLSNLLGKEIFLDRKSLEDAGLDLSRPVNMPDGVSIRTALRAVLQAQGLTFVIREKILQVVTLEKAQTMQLTRTYYLGGMVQGAGPLPFGVAAPWGDNFQQTQQAAKLIIDAITQSIDPMVWRERNGPATVTFHYPSLSLIVRAPAEVHMSFRGKLSGGK